MLVARNGFDDLVIGAPGADPQKSNSGSTYVVFEERPVKAQADAETVEGEMAVIKKSIAALFIDPNSGTTTCR